MSFCRTSPAPGRRRPPSCSSIPPWFPVVLRGEICSRTASFLAMDPRARASGRRAEEHAAILLRLQGFEILGRNVRTGSGEIDIVARDGAVLVIVEVRYRATHVLAAWHSLGRRKRESLLRAAGEAQAALRIPRRVP